MIRFFYHPLHRLTLHLLPVLRPALLYGAACWFASIAHAADPAGSTPISAPAPAPHIALLLPLDSVAFGRYANAVRQGFLAAAQVQNARLPVRVYSVNEDTPRLLTIYEQALEAGAQIVIGPLTRNGVSMIAVSDLVRVPVLALAFLPPNTPQPPRLYLFGLAVEAEARQLAQLAISDGHRNALIIGDGTPLSQRLRAAFTAEFSRLGGRLAADLPYDTSARGLEQVRQLALSGKADMALLSLDAARAPMVRPYLPKTLDIYASSQVNTSASSALIAQDLDGVRFLDMPWLLQPDHPAVMAYQRPQYGGELELERMYALGIDAYRIGLELLQQTRDPILDGVTGRIRLLGSEHQFVREMTPAQFVDGKIMVRDTSP